MSHHRPQLSDAFLTRRDFLCRCGMGMGALGLMSLLQDAFATPPPDMVTPLAPRAPHFMGSARRVVHFFLNGGPSHVDTFDPKPALGKYHGKPLPMESLRTERKTGAAFATPFAFNHHGQSGLPVSDLFPHLATC